MELGLFTAYAATVAVKRVAPRVTARTYNFLRLDPEGLSAHYELIYDVRRASVRCLSLLVADVDPTIRNGTASWNARERL